MIRDRLRHIGGDDTLVDVSAKKCDKKLRRAVKVKDGDVIYEMLSENVKKSEMAREDIDRIVELLHGTESSWEPSSTNISRKKYYGKKTVMYRKYYDIEINSEAYVLFIQECVRSDKKEDDLGIRLLILFYYDEDLGMPREYVGDYGVYIFSKEEVLEFKDELLNQREEEWAREEAELEAMHEAYEKEMAEKIKAEEEKEKKEKEKEKKEKEKKKKNSIRKTVGKKWKNLKKKSD